MQTEVAKDPVLLGVSLPLSVTVTAANQVKTAWVQAISEVLAAARAKAKEKQASVKKSTNGTKAEQPEITA
jgi:uncharacterized protein (DUF302 family)